MTRSALYESFLSFARERRLFAPRERVLAAVSGGPDSVAMFDILRRFSARGRIELFACHLDHRLRGKASTADAAFVRNLCRGLGVPLACARKDVRALAARRKLSIEAAARAARYEFFLRAARKFKCVKVATAHTLSDNAETILQRFFEGAGPEGLSGIPLSRALDENGSVSVVRPILFATRRDVEKYLSSRALQSRLDATNLEPLYVRNRIRLEILPRILELNPSAEKTISRAGSKIAALFEFVEDAVAAVRGEIVEEESPRRIVLKRKALLSVPAILAGEIVKRAILECGVAPRDFSSSHVDAVLKLARSGRPWGAASLPGGGGATVSYGKLTIDWSKTAFSRTIGLRQKGGGRRSPYQNLTVGDRTAPERFCRALPVPGKVALPAGAGRITAEAVRKFDLAKFIARKTRLVEVIDADCVKAKLVVRYPKPGDALRPLGAPGKKKLSDFFTDEKIPVDRRTAAALVADRTGIIWVAGYRIADRVKVTSRTKRFIRLSLEQV